MSNIQRVLSIWSALLFFVLCLLTVVAPAVAHAQGVDEATREAIREAILEIDALQTQALLNLDESILEPRVSPQVLREFAADIPQLRSLGIHAESELLDIVFISFRWADDGAIEVYLVETWETSLVDASGKTLDTLHRVVPQTNRLTQESGVWILQSAEFH